MMKIKSYSPLLLTCMILSLLLFKPVQATTTLSLPVNCTNSDFYTGDITITYTSSDPSVVSITKSGIMTTHKTGTATICKTRIVRGSVFSTKKWKVHVVKMSVTGKSSISVGSSTTIKTNVDKATFTSSNPKVATINSKTGKLTGITNGTTTITVTSNDCSVTHSVTVKKSNKKLTKKQLIDAAVKAIENYPAKLSSEHLDEIVELYSKAQVAIDRAFAAGVKKKDIYNYSVHTFVSNFIKEVEEYNKKNSKESKQVYIDDVVNAINSIPLPVTASNCQAVNQLLSTARSKISTAYAKGVKKSDINNYSRFEECINGLEQFRTYMSLIEAIDQINYDTSKLTLQNYSNTIDGWSKLTTDIISQMDYIGSLVKEVKKEGFTTNDIPNYAKYKDVKDKLDSFRKVLIKS